MAKYPAISDNVNVQAFYELMRLRGESHAIAEMCALRQPCGASNTDRAFWQGYWNQFANDPTYGEFARRKAKAAGVDIKGKIYQHGLADEPGDPKAWVSDLGDAKRRVKEMGASCDALGIKRRYLPEPKPMRVADDLVHAEMARRIERQPHLRKQLPKLKEQVREAITPII